MSFWKSFVLAVLLLTGVACVGVGIYALVQVVGYVSDEAYRLGGWMLLGMFWIALAALNFALAAWMERKYGGYE